MIEEEDIYSATWYANQREEASKMAHEEYCRHHSETVWCPECTKGPATCNCMVYKRQFYGDWFTRMKPVRDEEVVEVMPFQEWINGGREKYEATTRL